MLALSRSTPRRRRGRLYEVDGSATGITRFLYDGSDLVAEYNASGTLLRRYVHGLGAGDDPLVWFEGSGVADSARRYLYADDPSAGSGGSIVAVTSATGTVLDLNTYDEYGIPGSSNDGRLQANSGDGNSGDGDGNSGDGIPRPSPGTGPSPGRSPGTVYLYC